ncbi:unnamed protein product [Amoebophrya sp. A25]|nr:unnamed protein product [Amoebophrya sp. A25]|eukprot:GSA25T00013151001.1
MGELFLDNVVRDTWSLSGVVVESAYYRSSASSSATSAPEDGNGTLDVPFELLIQPSSPEDLDTSALKKNTIPSYLSRVGLRIAPLVSLVSTSTTSELPSATSNNPMSSNSLLALDLKILFAGGGSEFCRRVPVIDRAQLGPGVSAELVPFSDSDNRAHMIGGDLTLAVTADPKGAPVHGVHIYFRRMGEIVKLPPVAPAALEEMDQDIREHEAKQRSSSEEPFAQVGVGKEKQEAKQAEATNKAEADAISAMLRSEVNSGALPAFRIEFGQTEGSTPPSAISFAGGVIQFMKTEEGPFGVAHARTTWRLTNVAVPPGATQLVAVPFHGDVEGLAERSIALTDAQAPKRLAAVTATEDEYLMPGLVSIGLTPTFRDNTANGVAVYEGENCGAPSSGAPRSTPTKKRNSKPLRAVRPTAESENKDQQYVDDSPRPSTSTTPTTSSIAMTRHPDDENEDIEYLTRSTHRGALRYTGAPVSCLLVYAVNDVGESAEPFVLGRGVSDKVMPQLEGESEVDDREYERYLGHVEDIYSEKSRHYANAFGLDYMRELVLRQSLGRMRVLTRVWSEVWTKIETEDMPLPLGSGRAGEL